MRISDWSSDVCSSDLIAIPLQYREHVKQQIAEIAGIERTQTILILPVHFLSPAIGIGFALAGIQQFRRQAFVLPPIDTAAKLPRGPAHFLDPPGMHDLLPTQEYGGGIGRDRCGEYGIIFGG